MNRTEWLDFQTARLAKLMGHTTPLDISLLRSFLDMAWSYGRCEMQDEIFEKYLITLKHEIHSSN